MAKDKSIIESKFKRDDQSTYTEYGKTISFQYVTGSESVRTYLGNIKSDGTPSDDKVEIPTTIQSLRLPRECTVWGEELKDKENNLTGDIKLMKYGEDGGVPVMMKYIEKCPKLNSKWQEKHGYKAADSAIDIKEKTVIELDTQKDKQLIYFFLNCSYNGDNPNRMPDADILIRDYDENKLYKNAEKNLELANEAIGKYNIIKDNDFKLEQIAARLGLDTSNKGIYKSQLLTKVTTQADKFLKAYEDSINSIQIEVSKAIGNGVIVIEEDKIVLKPLDENGKTQKLEIGVDAKLFKEADHDIKIEMLVDFLNSDKGQEDLQNIQKENQSRMLLVAAQ